MLLPDERPLKPAKSPVLAPSPLLTKPASTPRVHSSSAPTSAYQEYRQGERDPSSVSKSKPSAHPLQTPSRRSFSSSLMSNKVAAHERQEDRRWENHNPASHSSPKTPPKPTKVRQPQPPNHTSAHNNDAAIRHEEIRDAIREQRQRQTSDQAQKQKRDANDAAFRREEHQDARLAQQQSQATDRVQTQKRNANDAAVRHGEQQDARREKELDRVARDPHLSTADRNEARALLHPPVPQSPFPEQPRSIAEVKPSLWDRGLDIGRNVLSEYRNFANDEIIGGGKAFLEAGKSLYSLANNPVVKLGTNPGGLALDLITRPKETLEESRNTIGGLYTLAKNPAIQSLTPPGAVINLAFRPKETTQAFGDLGSVLAKPYVDAWKSGHPGEAVGRFGVDFGTLFLPGGAITKIPKLSTTAEAAAVVAGAAEKEARAAAAARAAEETAARALDKGPNQSVNPLNSVESPSTPTGAIHPPKAESPLSGGGSSSPTSPDPYRAGNVGKAGFDIRGKRVTHSPYVTDAAVTHGRFFTYTLRDANGNVRYVGRNSPRRQNDTGAEAVFRGRMGSKGDHETLDRNFDEIVEIRIEGFQGNRDANKGAEQILYSRYQIPKPDPAPNGNKLEGGINKGGQQLLNRDHIRSARPDRLPRTREVIGEHSNDMRNRAM